MRLGAVVRLGEVLKIPLPIHEEMVAHAVAGLPYEACGLFAAKRGAAEQGASEKGVAEISQFYPMQNAAASQMIYQLDGKENLEVEIRAEDAGLEIIGVMHSHTHTPAYPSPTDVADASRFDPFGMMHFIIVSLEHEEPYLRSFKIKDGEIAEEEVLVISGDSGTENSNAGGDKGNNSDGDNSDGSNPEARS